MRRDIMVCVFLKLLGPSPGPQGVGLPTHTGTDEEEFCFLHARTSPRLKNSTIHQMLQLYPRPGGGALGLRRGVRARLDEP